jgi:hypothetical protein
MDRTKVDILPMPLIKSAKGIEAFDIDEIIHAFQNERDFIRCVFIEKQQIFPDQGSVSGGNLMYGYGLLIGIISALKIPRRIVAPQSWQKLIFEGMSSISAKDQRKARSVSVALALYPNSRDLLKPGRRRKEDHNLAEALLIAEYGVTTLSCEQP